MLNRRALSSGLRIQVPSFFALLFLALMWAGCSSKSTAPASTAVDSKADPDLFTMQDAARFPLVEVQFRPVRDELHVNGVIAPDVNRTVPVVSLAGGRVVDIKAKLGDYVHKGQTLLLINSPDFSQAFTDYQKFKADESLAAKQLARAQLLYDKGAIALADLEAAQDTDAKAKADLQAAAQRVRILGGNLNNPSPLLPVVAPISGWVVDQQTSSGTGVKSLDNSPNLFTIADLSTVWVLCDVYEDALARVAVGDTAQIALNAYPGRTFPGKVVNISAVLDPATRSAKVRIELPNPQGLMRPGMFATATFTTAKSTQRALVPSTAVVHLHDKDWVFLALDDKRFRRQSVQLGQPGPDGTVQVLSGLKGGEKIVANALQFASESEEQ